MALTGGALDRLVSEGVGVDGDPPRRRRPTPEMDVTVGMYGRSEPALQADQRCSWCGQKRAADVHAAGGWADCLMAWLIVVGDVIFTTSVP